MIQHAHICPLDYPCMYFLLSCALIWLSSSYLHSHSPPVFRYVLLYLFFSSLRPPTLSSLNDLFSLGGSGSIRVLGRFNSGTWGSPEHFGKRSSIDLVALCRFESVASASCFFGWCSSGKFVSQSPMDAAPVHVCVDGNITFSIKHLFPVDNARFKIRSYAKSCYLCWVRDQDIIICAIVDVILPHYSQFDGNQWLFSLSIKLSTVVWSIRRQKMLKNVDQCFPKARDEVPKKHLVFAKTPKIFSRLSRRTKETRK